MIAKTRTQETLRKHAKMMNGDVKTRNSAFKKDISVMVLKQSMDIKLIGRKTVMISLMKINRYVVRTETET